MDLHQRAAHALAQEMFATLSAMLSPAAAGAVTSNAPLDPATVPIAIEVELSLIASGDFPGGRYDAYRLRDDALIFDLIDRGNGQRIIFEIAIDPVASRRLGEPAKIQMQQLYHDVDGSGVWAIHGDLALLGILTRDAGGQWMLFDRRVRTPRPSTAAA